MAFSKIIAESMDLTDTYNFSGTVTGAGGITQADQWRTNADQSIPADTDTLVTGNWERNDTISTYIGNGMSESSGIFTFPTTGLYLILVVGDFYGDNSNSDYCKASIHGTTNNSSYSVITNNNQWIESGRWMSYPVSSFFDVTNVSTHKVKLIAHAQGSAKTLRGNTGYSETTLTFIRLGDT
jgi:hypothetical protein|tara:strand:+ start:493 stop:1038 length:546 start_codon:yes stop_codon:yes gene_type:complete